MKTRSFSHAIRGIWIFLKTTRNAKVHFAVLACVIISGFYFDITSAEWLALILASTIVLVAESINTAIEIDINLTSPNFHPYARDTKDVAAGAVLIASAAAALVGAIVFLPKIIF